MVNLEDDRLQMPLCDVDAELSPCIAHNAQSLHLESIIKNGLAPGGDGLAQVVHSQLSAFHLDYERLQESSRASSTDAIILCNVKRTKPLLSVTISGGGLATSQRIPSRFIDRIWIKREVPITMTGGRAVLSRRWITVVDRRAMQMRITGWFGVQNPG